jgi:hypothetical protein
MVKKPALILTGIVIALVVVLGLIMIGMRRARMMGSRSRQSHQQGGLVAVSPSGTPLPGPATSALPENTAMQQAGDLVVTLALNPYPPTEYQPSEFDVTLADASGKAISDATINLNLTMPEMWMPPNNLTMQPVSDGKYHAAGRFTMRGLWQIEVIILRGSEKQSVFFNVWL